MSRQFGHFNCLFRSALQTRLVSVLTEVFKISGSSSNPLSLPT